jgi:hypothetical protein
MLWTFLVVLTLGCARKSDPIPHALAAPASCTATWAGFRILEVGLPLADLKGGALVGVERVRIFFLPLGAARPSAAQVLATGEVILERSRPDLPSPGKTLRIDLRQIGRPAGWIVATAVRVGDVVGAPSEPVAWLDPAI